MLLFVGWFVLCIVLTMAGMWNVGNVAHGAGFVLGALLAWAIAARGLVPRLGKSALLVAVFFLLLAGASVS